MNWLLGDTTNLIGCILTNQLPFQTYLATYFCLVDLSLLVQYFYYARKAKAIPPAYLHGRERTISGTLGTRRYSIERAASAPRYRALSNVAANVAAVAALAAQQEEHSQRHGARSHSTEPRSPGFDDDDDVDEDALARLAESFHSEGGRTARRKQVAWGYDSYPGPGPASVRHSRQSSRVPHALQMSVPLDEPEAIPRGRSTVRAVDVAEDDEEWLAANSHRRSSRASRKGATMVFLGMWALFGVGTFAGSTLPHPNVLAERTGKVLARADVPPVVPIAVFPAVVVDTRIADPILSAQLAGGPAAVEFTRSIEDFLLEQPEPAPSMEFIIGRISAWICTVLYLTSRLPQIWKNFVRKSVEGLSIYLFIFAFLGNTFYVASILTSPNLQLPPPQASAFMRESIPYLLGSGGTLMFDVTIVCQSFLYRPKGSPPRGRHASRTYNEEEAGLLSAEATGAVEDAPVTSRRRGGSVSREPAAAL
ncbi:PQ loop repeat-domain-containing protein [Dichomitus squalens]|nr:PQ loop repeat-domain-containing protein [Dichomitus squalens]TBU65819.1 PQ loop repeat-domain-containing protein [Dichomitus squalens]